MHFQLVLRYQRMYEMSGYAGVVASSAASVTSINFAGIDVNIGTGKNHSVNEVASFISDDTINIPERPGEAKTTLADNRRAQRMLGWTPKITLEQYFDPNIRL